MDERLRHDENPQTLPGLRAGGKQRGKLCLSVFALIVAGSYTMDAVRRNPNGLLQEKRKIVCAKINGTCHASGSAKTSGTNALTLRDRRKREPWAGGSADYGRNGESVEAHLHRVNEEIQTNPRMRFDMFFNFHVKSTHSDDPRKCRQMNSVNR